MIFQIVSTIFNLSISGQILTDALNSFQHLVDIADDPQLLQMLMNQKLIEKVISICVPGNHEMSDQQSEIALKTVGSILSCNESKVVDIMIQKGVLDKLNDALTLNQSGENIKHCLWPLSNITAGTEEHILAFVNHPNLMNQIYFFLRSTNRNIKREALWVLCNLINTTTSEAIQHHVASYNNFEFIPEMVDCLKTIPSLANEILEAFDQLFKLDISTPLYGIDKMTYKFEINHGVDILEQLLNHQNAEVSHWANKINQTYFN